MQPEELLQFELVAVVISRNFNKGALQWLFKGLQDPGSKSYAEPLV